MLWYIKNDKATEKIKNIDNFVTKTLERLFSNKRHCHVGLINLKKFVELYFNKEIPQWNRNDNETLNQIEDNILNQKLTELENHLNHYFSRENRNGGDVEKRLKENANRLVGMLNLSNQSKSYKFLLFAYSRNVLIVISKIIETIDKSEIEIFICENNAKILYSPYGEVEYSDGTAYIRELINRKIIAAGMITLIPDVATGTLLEKNKIDAIFFGVNGLNYSDGKCAHSVGHLSITKLANQLDIPTIVVLDSIRIGMLEKPADELRHNCWFDSDGIRKKEIKDIGIKLWNPREDIFNVKDITFLISEQGVLQMKKIKPNKSKKLNTIIDLQNWALVYNKIGELQKKH